MEGRLPAFQILGGLLVDINVLRVRRNYLSAFTVITLVICFFIISKFYIGATFALEAAGTGLSVGIFPGEAFLQAINMKPGDVETGSLTIINKGEYDFSNNISSTIESGSQILYDALELQIQDETGTIVYTGKLRDLTNFPLEVLGIGKASKYNFTVYFPKECDNSYQQLKTSVKFIINALEHPPFIDDGSILWDPPLEKPDCIVRKGNIMPISFHLIKNGIFDTKKRGIDLIISGIDAFGKKVSYTFSIVNGTLEWQEHGLSKPHYRLKFDAGQNPIAQNTYYTATVKYGEQILGETKFKSGK